MVGRGKGRGQEREPFSFLGVGFMVPMRHLRKERCLPGYRSTKAGPGQADYECSVTSSMFPNKRVEPDLRTVS